MASKTLSFQPDGLAGSMRFSIRCAGDGGVVANGQEEGEQQGLVDGVVGDDGDPLTW